MKKLINLIALTIALAVVFVGCGNPAIPQDKEFIIADHILEPHLPEPVGVNEVLGKKVIGKYIGEESSRHFGEFIDNETFIITSSPKSDESYDKTVYKYSFDSTKKQIYLQEYRWDSYDKNDQLTESYMPEDIIKNGIDENPGVSEYEIKKGIFDYIGYHFGRCTVYSYTKENEKMILKPVFPCETLVDACYEYINFEFSNESEEMSLLSYGFLIDEDIDEDSRMVLFDKITDTTIFGKDLATNESYVIPYTIDFSKPDGEKTITITFKEKNITLTQREIDERTYEEVE